MKTTPEENILGLSFDSGGWLYLYHFGVSKYLLEHFEIHKNNNIKLFGSSAGSLVCAQIALGMPVEPIIEKIMTSLEVCKYNPFLMVRAVEEAVEKICPENAHMMLEDKIYITLSKISMGTLFGDENGSVKVHKFESRYYLIDVFLASCYMPIIAGYTPFKIESKEPKYINGYFYDGGILEALPEPLKYGCNSQILISSRGLPHADIKNFNMPREWSVIPPDKEALLNLYNIGYRDAAHFFSKSRGFYKELEKVRIKTPLLCISDKPNEYEEIDKNIHIHIGKRTFKDKIIILILFIVYLIKYSAYRFYAGVYGVYNRSVCKKILRLLAAPL